MVPFRAQVDLLGQILHGSEVLLHLLRDASHEGSSGSSRMSFQRLPLGYSVSHWACGLAVTGPLP